MQDSHGKPQAMRAPLTDRQKRIMLVVFLRDRKSFLSAKQQLFPEHFNEAEIGYAIVWSVVLDYYEEFGQLPPEEHMLAEIEHRLEEDPGVLTDEELQDLDQFIAGAYDIEQEQLIPRVAFRYLRMFLQDRLSEQVRETFQGVGFNPTDLKSTIGKLHEQAAAIDTVEESGLEKFCPEDWDIIPVEKRSTQIGFIDDYLNGGHAPGEVYGLMGPYGSCKTTLAVQLMARVAAAYLDEWEQSDRKGPLRYVYLFSYEEALDSLRIRGISLAGQIDRKYLEPGDWEKDLRQEGEDLRAYERELFSSSLLLNGRIPSEWDRFHMARNQLNVNCRICDMSGSDKRFPGRGNGMVDEIAQVIERDLEEKRNEGINAECGLVIVDYVGAAAERHADSRGLERDRELRHLVGKFPLHLKNKVALHFNTPVWALHQFSARANSLAPGVLPKRTDAAEARNFSENLDFCFVVGNPNSKNLCLFGCDKSRRGMRRQERVVHIDGAFCTVRDMDGKWVLEKGTRKIINYAESQRINGDPDAEDHDIPPWRGGDASPYPPSSPIEQTRSIRARSDRRRRRRF